MRASSSFASSGTSSPREARGTNSYDSSSDGGATLSASSCVGMSTRFGRGGADLRPGLICRSVKGARMIRGVATRENPLELAILGAGYVGLVTAACLARLGHRVVCIDRDEGRVERLTQGIM